MTKSFSVRLPLKIEQALEKLATDPNSPVMGKPRNYIISWAIANVQIALEQQEDLGNFLPAKAWERIRQGYKEWVFKK